MPRLSRTDLNNRLKEKLYKELFSDVISHLEANPNDVDSPNFFCNALSFHFYGNRLVDAAAAAQATRAVVLCYEIFAARPKNLDAAAVKKAGESSEFIIFKGFLRDGWLDHTVTLCEALEACFTTLDVPVLGRLFALTKRFASSAQKAMVAHGSLVKEVKRLLSSNVVLKTSVPEAKSVAVLQMHLEVLSLVGKAKAGKDGEVAKEIFCVLDNLEETLESKLNAATTECSKFKDEFVLVCCKLVDALPSSRALEAIGRAKKMLMDLHSKQPSFMPSPRSMGCLGAACELHLEKGDVKEANSCLELLDGFVTKLQSVGSDSSLFVASVLLAVKEFLTVRMAYDAFASEVHKEMKERAQQENQSAAPSGEERGDAEKLLEIGDCNPYSVGIRLEREEEIVMGLFRSVHHLQQALSKGCFTSLPLKTLVLLRMILSVIHLLTLLGHSDKSREAAMVLFKFACGCQNQYFKTHSAAQLLTMDLGYDEEIVGTCKSALEDLAKSANGKESNLLLLVPAAQALRDFHDCNNDRASQIAGEVLGRLKTMSSTVSNRVLLAQIYRLLTLVRCTPGSYVTYPAPQPLPERFGGQREVAEAGPLELINEAFKHSSIAEYNSCVVGKRGVDATAFVDFLRAACVHSKVVATRLDLCAMVKLPKEMRLYAKIQFEYTGKCGLAYRSAESLLSMAEIDLLCDDPTQAKVKLDAVKRIIAPLIDDPDIETVNKGKKKKVKKVKGVPKSDPGASPMLRRSDFRIPDWIEHPPECLCYPCCNPRFLGGVVRYFNCVGLLHHHNNDKEAAAAYFEGTQTLLRHCEKKLSEQKCLKETEEDVKVAWMNCLQMQIDCYGRDEYFSRCDELLRLQVSLVNSLPKGFLSRNVYLQTRLSHLSLILRMVEDPLELSGIENKMNNMELSPAPPKNADDFKTPAVRRTKRLEPKGPTKRLIP